MVSDGASEDEVGRSSVHQQALQGIRDLADRPVMVNATRSRYVEFQIGALLQNWEQVGDWDGWDLQRGSTRLEVKAAAARQAWNQDGPSTPRFDIAPRDGHFVGNDWVTRPGRQAHIYVFAWHGVFEESRCDQRDERQWEYYVVRSSDLPPKQKSISLTRLRVLTDPVPSSDLKSAVDMCDRHATGCMCVACRPSWMGSDGEPHYRYDKELEAEASHRPGGATL